MMSDGRPKVIFVSVKGNILCQGEAFICKMLLHISVTSIIECISFEVTDDLFHFNLHTS